MTSQAINESASKVSAVPKLCTCRLQLPAPRSSSDTSAAATRRLGRERVARAPQIAIRPRPDSVYAWSMPRYTMSAGPSNTDARGDSSKVSPAQVTEPPPASGRIITSVTPVCRSTLVPSKCKTCSEDSLQPADSGVTWTV